MAIPLEKLVRERVGRCYNNVLYYQYALERYKHLDLLVYAVVLILTNASAISTLKDYPLIGTLFMLTLALLQGIYRKIALGKSVQAASTLLCEYQAVFNCFESLHEGKLDPEKFEVARSKLDKLEYLEARLHPIRFRTLWDKSEKEAKAYYAKQDQDRSTCQKVGK